MLNPPSELFLQSSIMHTDEWAAEQKKGKLDLSIEDSVDVHAKLQRLGKVSISLRME
ncbi:hypothetical protein SLEP1_g17540 [Rubroshorea leprosula]|uniref:Uncharacterized protein n=1 Tax=Rubroshorea leprosula TaxID=152421 RepID=A0AAV5J3U8_9ROSI|nr:hypothetical protein SLEP1_g17540 [Rubroshorea leprosula]